ncbi:DM13 domain-containing protein [Acrocarpospora catenulata]|uniref:DM13 domain-containing protein n=1 Tax=Acrocarpospora catenulata TaxID=2836182 RepID=UPI0027DFFC2A|nr:DM13 domain-containing protein [Acrocarpospora catenulata]
MRNVFRHPVTWIVVAAGVAVALYLFQPWRLFTTVEVNEPPPVAATGQAPTGEATMTGEDMTGDVATPAASPEGPRVLSMGTFITHEHETSGVAKVLQLPNGERVLRIENLDTSDGPDLRVWLSDQPVKEGEWRVFDDGEWLELGELKGNKGNANYPIPASADLDSLTSVTIWCRRFAVSFGAAPLAA